MAVIDNRTNIAVIDLGAGRYRLTKAAGGLDAFDASAASVTAIAGDFVAEGRVPTGTPRLAIGVTADVAEGDDAATIDRAILIDGATMTVMENGVVETAAVPHGGAVWIVRNGTTLTYRCGANLAASSVQRSVGGIGGALYLDASIATLHGVVEVRFAPPEPAIATRRGHVAIGIGF